MKYVVSGYIGFDNFGDEAVAHVLSEKLKHEGAEKITFISANPQKTSELHNVFSCGMFNFMPALIESDTLISGGGSLLQDVTSLKSLLYYLSIIFIALLLNKKVEIFAQGIGPIKTVIGKILTKSVLKRASKISVRDTESQELLKQWGIESELVKDPVFDINVNNKNKKGIVGIQLRKYTGVNDDFLNRLANEIANRFSDKKIEILSLQDSIDLDICNNFLQKLKEQNINNVSVLSNLSVNDVTDKISDLEYLIAMRFHANVIGIKSGVKTLAINYDPKVEKLAKEYNLPIINLDDKDFSNQFNNLF